MAKVRTTESAVINRTASGGTGLGPPAGAATGPQELIATGTATNRGIASAKQRLRDIVADWKNWSETGVQTETTSIQLVATHYRTKRDVYLIGAHVAMNGPTSPTGTGLWGIYEKQAGKTASHNTHSHTAAFSFLTRKLEDSLELFDAGTVERLEMVVNTADDQVSTAALSR